MLKGPAGSNSALIQAMAWHHVDAKPLPPLVEGRNQVN